MIHTSAIVMHFYFPGMIVGIIILQTSIVAPTLSKKLEISEFGKAIRALWPKFFIILTILGAATLASLYFGHYGSVAEYSIAGTTTLFAAICYAIIPATNRASDEGDKKKFDLLHKISVYLTVVMLLINIGFFFV